MGRDDPQLNVHIPMGLKRSLELAANREHRSITNELIVRLERSFEADRMAMGIAEEPPGYDVIGGALDTMPASIRKALAQLLTSAARGMPIDDELSLAYRTNKPKSPPPRSGVRKKKRAIKKDHSGNGSDK